MVTKGKLYAVPVGRHFIEIRLSDTRPKCLRSVVKLFPVKQVLQRRMAHYPYWENYEKEITPVIRTVVYEGGEVLATFKRADFFRLCGQTEGMKQFVGQCYRTKTMKELPEEGGANLLKQLHKRPGRAVR